MTIGERIQELRKSKDMTLEYLAKLAGTTKQTINKYEKGIVTNIPYDRIVKLAEIFGVTPGYIMGWNESENDILMEAAKAAERQQRIDKLPPEAIKLLDAYVDMLLKMYCENK